MEAQYPNDDEAGHRSADDAHQDADDPLTSSIKNDADHG
jgi:hypothetical protein